MKKIIKYACIATISLAVASCGDTGKKEMNDENMSDNEEMIENSEGKAMSGNFDVNAAESEVLWEGNMLKIGGVSLYGHKGNIAIHKGMLMAKDGQIASGTIVIDMASIKPMDDNYDEKEGKTKDKLVGHLSSDDFFAVEKYPTATFKITGSDGKTVKGDMTIRGVTHPETIELKDMEMDNDRFKAKGEMVLDRQKYEVAYQGTAEDKVLSDDLELDFTIVANKTGSM